MCFLYVLVPVGGIRRTDCKWVVAVISLLRGKKQKEEGEQKSRKENCMAGMPQLRSAEELLEEFFYFGMLTNLS